MSDLVTTSALDTAVAQYRAALLARDEAALRQIMAASVDIAQRIQARVAVLTTEIAQARARGERIRPEWLREQRRLIILQEQIRTEWQSYAAQCESIITETQRAAIEAARVEAVQLTLSALDDVGGLALGGNLSALRMDALTDLIGTLQDGSPLRALLDSLGEQAARDVADALQHAVAIGRSPRATARDIRTALGGDLQRALRIARTEHLRAYRSTALRTYQSHGDLVRGWMWRASPSRRTCPVCLAMDGTEHTLDEPFIAHPQCRCTPIPLLRSFAAPDYETGADWFNQQSAETQRGILGEAKYARYAAGTLTLRDLVGVRQDVRWGASLYEKSLKEIL